MNEKLINNQKNDYQTTTSSVIKSEKFLKGELNFWYSKFQNGDIDNDKLDDIHDKMDDFYDDYEKDFDKFKKEYENYKQDILAETGIEFQKEGELNKIKLEIYNEFGINKLTYRNGTIDRFSKGIIDGLFENAELIQQIIETKGLIILEGLKNLLTIEGITQIIKGLGESIVNLFIGDAYQKGKLAGELLPSLITGGAGILGKKILSKSLNKTIRAKGRQLSKEKIIKTINETPSNKIDISKLNSENKAIVNEIITNNFPLVEITRITPNQNLVNVTIGGIKKLNDNFGQGFSDNIIGELKYQIRQKFELSRNNGFNNRVVKDDYKNLSFLNSSNNIAGDIFGGLENKKQLIKEVVLSLNKQINAYARDLIYKELETKKLPYSSKKEFDKHVLAKAKEIRASITQNLDFGIGAIETKDVKGYTQRLSLVRKAESAAKDNLGKESLEVGKYSQDVIIQKLEKAQNIYEYMNNNLAGKKFEFRGVQYDIINNGEISEELLRYVRKYPGEIKPSNVSELVQKYYTNLNSSLDFISPVKGELNKGSFDRAHKINTQIRDGIIDKKFMQTTYKGGVTKEYLFSSTRKMDGTAVFIDIKDMGIDNIKDFQLRSEKILEIRKKVKEGHIDEATANQKIEKLMLQSGKSVTDKFIRLQEEITKIYPDGVLSFGGDEIYLFIPDGKKASTFGAQELKQIINSNGQSGRILHQKTPKGKNKEDVFNFLDKFSKVNKSVEFEAEKILKKNGLDGVFNSNSLEFSQNIISQISRQSFNFDNFIKNFENRVSQINFRTDLDKKIRLKDIYEGINGIIEIKDGNIKIILDK